jgi:hypothetical protein
VLEEVLAAGVEQVIIVSAAPAAGEPHALVDPRLDGRGRLGEWLRSQETATLRDALSVRMESFKTLHLIRPDHNPVGCFDFATAYDGRSDRMSSLAELIDAGYADAYRQFVEPVVGAAEVTT